MDSAEEPVEVVILHENEDLMDRDAETVDGSSVEKYRLMNKCNLEENESKTEDDTGVQNDLTDMMRSSDVVEMMNVDVDMNESLPVDASSSTAKGNADGSIIKAIDKNVVHRICSGQVVVTLATAVKELVENSIDAGATTVDIRLTEYGSKCIEVTDNGRGVEEANFEGLGLKHHTSKIKVFEDLTCVETFGFRGEALSSLCALSCLTVVTKSECCSKQGQGFRIEYDSKGRITQKTYCAREVGTTVILKNLFFTLPIRHMAFLKNLKREFSKMVSILYGYCLISSGVRITCTNLSSAGAVSKVLSVPASTTAKEKIVSLFGSKQLDSLIEIKEVSKCRDEGIITEYGLTEADKEADNPFTLRGYISLPYKGRSSNDRQFYFINSRPCEPTKISRIVNEVYHGYSKNQSPFIFLDIRTKQEDVDVNVTPDKRQIYLRNEKILHASIKETLVTLLASATSAFTVDCTQLPTFSNSYLKSSPRNNSCTPQLQGCASLIADSDDNGSVDMTELPSTRPVENFPTFPQQNSVLEQASCLLQEPVLDVPTKFVPVAAVPSGGIKNFFKKYQFKSKSFGSLHDKDEVTPESSNSTRISSEGSGNGITPLRGKQSIFQKYGNNSKERHCTEIGMDQTKNQNPRNIIEHNVVNLVDSDADDEEVLPLKVQNNTWQSASIAPAFGSRNIAGTEDFAVKRCKYYEEPKICSSKVDSEPTDDDDSIIVYDDEFAEDADVRKFVNAPKSETEEPYSFLVYGSATVVSCRVNWSDVKQKCLESSRKKRADLAVNEGRKFRAGISAAENNAAEEELKKQLSKDMFKEMQIIGQFNTGFIIVRHGPDIFIIDQHATDEKFNFEDLEKNLVLQSQRLISPIDLQLPAVNESILMDNIDVFRKNGFDFSVDESEVSTRKLQMTQIPYSKSCEFGKRDVEELIFLLEEAPEKSFFRPSRVRDMLASRACRKSVMIGTALNNNEMRRLVDHMGVMEQPWNCPHGRPTVRHLFNLNMIPHNDIFKYNH